MSTPRVHVVASYSQDALIANCQDTKLNDEVGIQAWGEELYHLVDTMKGDKIVVNFSSVSFMSSSSLRVLITLNSRAKNKKVKLALCGINSNIMEAFKITRLDTIFKIKETEFEAIKALS